MTVAMKFGGAVAIAFVTGTLFGSIVMRTPGPTVHGPRLAFGPEESAERSDGAVADLIASVVVKREHHDLVLGDALVADHANSDGSSLGGSSRPQPPLAVGGTIDDQVETVWNRDRLVKFLLPVSSNPLEYVGEARKALGKAAWADDFMNRSTEIALRDGRTLVICPYALQHAGHGNAHFVAAGMTALAHRFNLLPVVPCRKNGKLNTSPFQNFHCVNEKAVKWKGLPDGGGMADLAYQSRIENLVKGRATGGPNIFINGYFQYWHGMSYAQDAVCWAFQPDAPTQAQVRTYFEDTVLGNLSKSLGKHSQLVAVHVRRGDYVNAHKKELHGALSVDYYKEAWRLLHARVRLGAGADAAANLVVLVFAADNSLGWARENLKFPGAKAVQFVDPNQKGRGPAADVDMLALALVDYFILANSTFCWWAHFYSECRRRFPGWWTLPWQHARKKAIEPLFTVPHRWHKFRDKGLPQTYLFMQSAYIVPRTGSLFEEYDGFTNENGTAVDLAEQTQPQQRNSRRRKKKR